LPQFPDIQYVEEYEDSTEAGFTTDSSIKHLPETDITSNSSSTELPNEFAPSPTTDLPGITESPNIIPDSGTDTTSDNPNFDNFELPTTDYSLEEIEESTHTPLLNDDSSRQGKGLGTPEIFKLPVTTTPVPDYVADLVFTPSLPPEIQVSLCFLNYSLALIELPSKIFMCAVLSISR